MRRSERDILKQTRLEALVCHRLSMQLRHDDRYGPLQGLKLIGFAIWQRRGADARSVTFPARQLSVNVERRSFPLLRPIADTTG